MCTFNVDAKRFCWCETFAVSENTSKSDRQHVMLFGVAIPFLVPMDIGWCWPVSWWVLLRPVDSVTSGNKILMSSEYVFMAWTLKYVLIKDGFNVVLLILLAKLMIECMWGNVDIFFFTFMLSNWHLFEWFSNGPKTVVEINLE